MIESFTNMLQNLTVKLNIIFGGNDFAVGAVIATLGGISYAIVRNLPARIYAFMLKHFTTSMSLNSATKAYYLLMENFHENGLSSNVRTIKVSNGFDGEGQTNKDLGYGNHFFFYRGVPIIVNISRIESGAAASRQLVELMTIHKLGRSHKIFDEMLSSIQNNFKNPLYTTYYTRHKWNTEYLCQQPKRQLDKVFLDYDVKEKLKNAIDSFINKEEWFIEYNIPFQLGILLYGKPGTGKTSLLKAIAAYMDRDIIIVKDVEGLVAACETASNAIICVEEIDTFGLSNRLNEENVNDVNHQTTDDISSYFGKRYLSEVLQALDGVISNHGRIVVMTTNHEEALDEALVRPGRIDLQLKIDFFNEKTFIEMLRSFFGDEVDNYIDGFEICETVSGASVQRDIIVGLTLAEIFKKYSKEM